MAAAFQNMDIIAAKISKILKMARIRHLPSTAAYHKVPLLRKSPPLINVLSRLSPYCLQQAENPTTSIKRAFLATDFEATQVR